jgi:hypothetical protein
MRRIPPGGSPRRSHPYVVHGTPITPNYLLEQLAGHSFCVSFAHPAQLERVLSLQDPTGILLLDNGAFTFWRSGRRQIDSHRFFQWANAVQQRHPAAVAVIPDVIGGDEASNWISAEIAVHELSASVDRLMFCWHMTDSLEQLVRAARSFNYLAIASCGEYDVQRYRQRYLQRQQEILTALWWVATEYGHRPWIHLMRGVAVLPSVSWADSADSTNIARNHARRKAVPQYLQAMAAAMQGPVISARQELLSRPARPISTAVHRNTTHPYYLRALLRATRPARPATDTWALVCLDRCFRPASIVILTRSPIESVILDPDDLAQQALTHQAFACVLLHESPSDSLSPLRAHHEILALAREALAPFHIEILDLLLLSGSGCIGLSDEFTI